MLTETRGEDGCFSFCSIFHFLYGFCTAFFGRLSLLPVIVSHIGFEVWENTERGGIKFFHDINSKAGMTWPEYSGDSVLNSQFDNLCCICGWYIATNFRAQILAFFGTNEIREEEIEEEMEEAEVEEEVEAEEIAEEEIAEEEAVEEESPREEVEEEEQARFLALRTRGPGYRDQLLRSRQGHISRNGRI